MTTHAGWAGGAPPREGRDLTWIVRDDPRFRYAFGFGSPSTRVHARLPGPCFKTGRVESGPSLLTLSAPRLARPAQGSGRRARLPSPHHSNSPARPGSREGSAVVPRSLDGPPPGAVTAFAEALAYLPPGVVVAAGPVGALCPRKMHTAGPGGD